MKKFLPCFIALNICLFICNAQNCNNWLNTPSVSSSVNIGDLDVPGNQITVEATINRTQPYLPGGGNNTEGDVVSKHNDFSDVNYLLRPNHAYITTTNGFFATPDICDIELNRIYHVAMVYDGSTLKFYRDGFLMSQVNASGNLFQNNWNTRIGHYDPAFWATQFIGYTNEVRIWKVVRTQSQIKAYMNTPLPSPTSQTGLLAYYQFNDLLNKQGNATFNGTLNGSASINTTNTNCSFIADSCAKIINNCSNWLGTPSTPSYASMGQINITGNKITVEATFNRTTPYSGGLLYAGDLVSKHNTPADVNYLLRPNEAEITTSNGYFRTPDICEIELNKTYHAAMVYDGTTLKFYRNGFLMSQIAATGDLFQNNWQTRIGWYEPQGFNTNFIGFINEVRIWNVAKTQTELNTYMNASLPTPTAQPGLVAYYTFDNLLNKQGNATYDGVLGGSATINQINPDCAFVADSCSLKTANPCNFDFSYKQDACNPLAVQFFNIGNTPVSPYWSFGDGTTVSGSANPSHVFTTTGNYPVKYTVQNTGCTDSITKNISVNISNQNIILTQDTTICFGTSKQLITAPALGFCWSPTIYLSDPNNANPSTNTPVPITYYFTAEIPGSNLITNGDFNGGNTGFTSQYNFASPNITEAQYFIGSNPQSWNASLSNCTDHTSGNGNMLLVNGAPAPDVTVWNQTVSVTPNTNYAFSTWIQALYTPNPAQLSFSINGGDVGTLITASLPTCTWSRFYTTWNSGNNTSASISIVNKNTLVQGNDFALDDISFSPVLIKRDSVIITIDHPIVKTNNDTLVCAGNKVQLTATGATTYNWLPAVGLSNAAISNPIATTINTMQYIVTGTSAKGCSASDTVNIITKPKPVLTKTADTVICKSNSLQLLATGGVSYQWFPINGLNNSSIPNPIATPINSTTYSVIVTGTNSCTTTDSVKVTVKPQPLFTISPADTTCFNTAVQLNASGGDVYSWSPVALVSNPNIANPSTAGNANTTYTVLIKEFACNNSATLTTSITVLPIPTIKASKSNDINCSIGNAQLSVTGAGQYAWSPGGSLNNSAIANPIANPASTTLYFVTGTDFVTNCIAKDTVTVFVNKGGATTFFIPSAFSPNGDGVNDCFKVNHFSFLKSVDISIYNRYGSLVFHTTSDSDCWDGTYKGTPSEPGNYVYYIKAEDNCEPFYKKGNLLPIR